MLPAQLLKLRTSHGRHPGDHQHIESDFEGAGMGADESDKSRHRGTFLRRRRLGPRARFRATDRPGGILNLTHYALKPGPCAGKWRRQGRANPVTTVEIGGSCDVCLNRHAAISQKILTLAPVSATFLLSGSYEPCT